MMKSIKPFPGIDAIILFSIMLLPCLALSDEKPDSSQQLDSAKVVAATPRILPKLLDLGSTTCIPCKKMAPILEEMKVAYDGKAVIEFIDINKNRDATLKHKVTLIPTQIFFDTLGVEVFRHVGFFPADSISAHLKALGVK
jgi:thioredoxin 1